MWPDDRAGSRQVSRADTGGHALPSFAQIAGGECYGAQIASQYQGLSPPQDKTITLSVIAGASQGLERAFELPREILGRGGADIEIGDPEVSGWHCAAEVANEIVRLRDLDLTNGTCVDGERVRAAALTHLSRFRIGSTVVLLTITPRKPQVIT